MKLRKILILVFSIILTVCLAACDKKEESYRIIKLVEMTGSVTYTRDDETSDVYDNMNFENGDAVVTAADSNAKLLLDSDKYLYMAADTSIKLNATGDEKDSKTTIELISGEISCDIQKELSGSSMYEVETSNATIGVHGTIFWVEVEDGKTYVYCEDGEVEVKAGSNTSVLQPKQAIIVEGDTITVVPVEDVGWRISEFVASILQNIQDMIEEGNIISGLHESMFADVEPQGKGYEMYCEHYKPAVTVYIPEALELDALGNIGPTLDDVYLMAIVYDGTKSGITEVSLGSDYTWMAKHIAEGYMPSSDTYKGLKTKITPMLPVANGCKCYLIEYSYTSIWDRLEESVAIVVLRDGCDGNTESLTLQIRFASEVSDWTLADFQRLAYQTFGK